MIIYNYNYLGRYTYSSEADESPLEPNVYLIPANATTVTPPSVDSLHIQVWNGSEWTIQELTTDDEGYDTSRFSYSSMSDNSPYISVTGVSMLIISNTATTILSAINDGFNGQEITLIFTNENTKIQNNSSIKLNGAIDYNGTTNSTLKLICYSNVWYETSRSINS